MKFETKFGLGEIVAKEIYRGDELVGDELLEVIAIVVAKSGMSYHCRHPNSMQLIHFEEHELIGDPDYDQEAGGYPVKENSDGE